MNLMRHNILAKYLIANVPHAVVTLYGPGYKDPASIQLVSPAFAEGRVRALILGPTTITNGNSINSKIYLGKMPSNAIPLFGMASLAHEAVAGVTSFDIGLERDGTVVNANVLAAALDISTAGTKDPFAGIAIADRGKRLWELLALASDPGCEYDVVAKLNAAATATKLINGYALYAKK